MLIFFMETKDIWIYYENVDYLTIKLTKENAYLQELEKMDIWEQKDVWFMGFKIKYHGLTAWSQLKVFFMHNGFLTAKWEYQQIGAIHIKQETEKKNKNMNTDIELVGLCWYKYKDLTDRIYNLLNVDKDKRDILTRIDYAFDLTNITVDDVYKLCKEHVGEWELKTYAQMIWESDEDLEKELDKLENWAGNIKTFNWRITWFIIRNDRHTISVYDKKFQILQKRKYKEKIDIYDENGEKCGEDYYYKHYIEKEYAITRIEFRKNARSFGDFENNSINETMQVIRNQAISFINKKFDLDLSTIVKDYKQNERIFNEKKDDFCIWFAEKKSKIYLDRGLSYISNYAFLNSEKKLFKMLQMQYWSRIEEFFLKDYKEVEDMKNLFV